MMSRTGDSDGLKGAEWRSGEGRTTQIGHVNDNGQRCEGTLGVPGTDHLQKAYRMHCGHCGHCGFVYGANGAAIFERRCPNCQGGESGIRYWLER